MNNEPNGGGAGVGKYFKEDKIIQIFIDDKNFYGLSESGKVYIKDPLAREWILLFPSPQVEV